MTRAAFTLFELILTMAVLVIIVGLSFPLAQSYLSGSRVSAGADLIRANWARMRSKAIEDGRPYQLKYLQTDGKMVKVAIVTWPDSPDDAEGHAVEAPEGVSINVDDPSQKDGADGWKSAGIIMPDGTALENVTVQVYPESRKGRYIELRMRAFTGSVSSQELTTGGPQQ
jgi:hypothetical protein